MLDLRYAAHGHSGELSVAQSATTYDVFASKVLRQERTIAFALYVRYYSYPQLWVFVVWRRGALRAVVRDNDGNVIGYVPVSRPSRTSVKVALPKALLGDPPSYRWAAFTTDRSGTDATLEHRFFPETGTMLIGTVLHDYTAPVIGNFSVPDPTTNASASLAYPVTFDVRDQGSAGIRRWRLDRRMPGGSWSMAAVGTGAGSKRVVLRGVEATSYEHRVVATDRQGNRARSAVVPATVPLDDSNPALATSFTEPWTATASNGAFLATLHSTSSAGAIFSYSFNGSHTAWIAPASQGTAEVRIDGGAPEAIDLGVFNGVRQVVFARDVPAGVHTVAMTVTSGTVSVDAIVVSTPPVVSARRLVPAEDMDGTVLPRIAMRLPLRALSESFRYADSWRGWPVAPLHQQHPIRGSFLDPRPAGFHIGIDIGVRDDRPEAGAPRGRTHRVFAVESGVVAHVEDGAPIGCAHRRVVVAHFDYRHVDAVVSLGQFVQAGQMIGWTCQGMWHVHLTETADVGGGAMINPLHPGGKLAPFGDSAAPVIHSIRFFRPAGVIWLFPGAAMWSPVTGDELAPDGLNGVVDPRAWISDPQSFHGWLDAIPGFYADHLPTRVRVNVVRASDGRIVLSRTVFGGRVFPYGMPFNKLFAMGTMQNLSAKVCYRMRNAGNPPRECEGRYVLHLFAHAGAPYWDTRVLPNGNYRLRVTAWDSVGNASAKSLAVKIAN